MSHQLRPADVRPRAPREGATRAYPDYRSIALFLIVVCVVFSGLQSAYFSLRVSLHKEDHFYDFGHFYFYADMIRQDKPYWDKAAIAEHAKTTDYAYCPHPPTYLPAVFMAFEPLTHLGINKARFAWVALDLMLLLTSLALIAAALDLHRNPVALAAICFIAFNYHPLRANTEAGQTNNVCLLFLALGLLLNTRGWRFLAGGAVALAAVCKFTPALMLGYFIWKRNFRACFGFVVVLAACILIPVFVLGADAQIAEFENLRHFATFQSFSRSPVNHAFGNCVARLIGERDGDISPERLRVIKGFVVVYNVFILTFAAWLTWPRKHHGRDRLAFEYALGVGAMIVLGSLIESHHCVWLLIPFAVLLTTPPDAQPKCFWPVLGIAYLLIGLEYYPDRFRAFWHGPLSVMLMGKFVGILLLWCLTAVVTRRYSGSRSAVEAAPVPVRSLPDWPRTIAPVPLPQLRARRPKR